MASYSEKSNNEIWDRLIKMDWKFDDRFDRCFLPPEEVEDLNECVSILRSRKAITIDERGLIEVIIKLGRDRYNEYQEKLKNEPRKDAQKFIGKKNIREFIFKRDGYKCLKCNSGYSLSLDHIVPINRGGLNRIYNLQTLCMSCNASKSTMIADYRK